jgi:hypothetical protein
MTNSERSGTTVSKLKKEVFDMFPDDPTFKSALKFYTRAFGGLVWVNGGGNRQGLTQCVFWYSCRHLIGDFTLDCPMMDLVQEVCGKTQEEIEIELTTQIEAKFKEDDDFGDGGMSGFQNGDVKYVKKEKAVAPVSASKKSKRKKDVYPLEDILRDLNDEERDAILLQEREEREAEEREARGELEDDPDYEDEPKSAKRKPTKRKSANEEKKRKARDYAVEDSEDSVAIMRRNKIFEFSRDNEDEENVEYVD